MERIVAGACGLAGLYWTYMGLFKYKFWVNKGPGGGFMPVLLGVLTVALSIVAIIKSKNGEPNRLELKKFVPPVMALLAVGSIYLIGMIGTVLVIVFAWLKFLENYSYKRAGLIGICAAVFIYGVFILWLQVPFPKGFIGI